MSISGKGKTSFRNGAFWQREGLWRELTEMFSDAKKICLDIDKTSFFLLQYSFSWHKIFFFHLVKNSCCNEKKKLRKKKIVFSLD